MRENGFVMKPSGGGMMRLDAHCPHQSGVIYTLPADKSWVCEDEWRAGHVLVGFMKDLAKLEDPRIAAAMQRWGLYFRERPLDGEDS